jgi:diguanylate cyclase (GGDEF)-like protein
MFLDLDHFKNVNDSLGHHVGDMLLKQLAERLKAGAREEDTIARLGGDEFILALSDADAEGAARVAEKLIESISQPYKIDQYELIVTPSIGIALYPEDGEDLDSLFKCADSAMYHAKENGRNHYRFFTSEMHSRSARILKLENALRHAVEQNQLRLNYQPQLSLQNGRIIGVEALVRWQHPEFGLVPPAEFIPIAEETGQILKIGEWVLRNAVAQLAHWIADGMEPMIMAVNLSAVQFRHANLPELITCILQEANLPPHYLELELTETVAMNDPFTAIEMIRDLHARGIRMSIDDFGTGYSSLSYLKRLKVYKLKIDQSFVRDINEDADDKAIVLAIINMAKNLGLQTIAEGVETLEQQAFLREHGCDEAQGYYYSKPLPADQVAAFIKARNQEPITPQRV